MAGRIMTADLTRDDLDDAAFEALEDVRPFEDDGGWVRGDAKAVVGAVLPLIADAIENAPIPFTADRERMQWGRGVQIAMAKTVLGLMGADDE